jgi:hypothetical protein
MREKQKGEAAEPKAPWWAEKVEVVRAHHDEREVVQQQQTVAHCLSVPAVMPIRQLVVARLGLQQELVHIAVEQRHPRRQCGWMGSNRRSRCQRPLTQQGGRGATYRLLFSSTVPYTPSATKSSFNALALRMSALQIDSVASFSSVQYSIFTCRAATVCLSASGCRAAPLVNSPACTLKRAPPGARWCWRRRCAC